MAQRQVVRAMYHEGTLQLLGPVDLPEGVELQITVPVVEALETVLSQCSFEAIRGLLSLCNPA